MSDLVQCPECRGSVPADAVKCMHCGSNLAGWLLWRVFKRHPIRWSSGILVVATIGIFGYAGMMATAVAETCAAGGEMGAELAGSDIGLFTCSEQDIANCDVRLNPANNGGFSRNGVTLSAVVPQYYALTGFVSEQGVRFDPAQHQVKTVEGQCAVSAGEPFTFRVDF